MTSETPYAPAMSSYDAMREFKALSDKSFQAEMVEQFIQAIGIFPAGTLVELSSGEIGVVVAEYRTRRLRPRVLILLDANKKKLRQSKVIDLQECAGDPASGESLSIKKSLESDAYGIDISTVSI